MQGKPPFLYSQAVRADQQMHESGRAGRIPGVRAFEQRPPEGGIVPIPGHPIDEPPHLGAHGLPERTKEPVCARRTAVSFLSGPERPQLLRRRRGRAPGRADGVGAVLAVAHMPPGIEEHPAQTGRRLQRRPVVVCPERGRRRDARQRLVKGAVENESAPRRGVIQKRIGKSRRLRPHAPPRERTKGRIGEAHVRAIERRRVRRRL